MIKNNTASLKVIKFNDKFEFAVITEDIKLHGHFISIQMLIGESEIPFDMPILRIPVSALLFTSSIS